MNTGYGQIWNAASVPASGSIDSSIFSISDDEGFAIQLSWSGAITGTFILQASCDQGTIGSDSIVSNVSTFDIVKDQTGIQISIPALGSSGTGTFNLQSQYYRYVKVTYLATSGTGTVSANYNKKGTGS